MKKQFLSLLALVGMMLVCGGGSAWAQTEVTATWAFDQGTANQEATLSNNSYFNDNYVEIGTNLSFNGTKSVGDFKETAILLNNNNGTPTKENDKIDFMLYFKKGIKFTPTSVSFRATRFGTNGGRINVKWVNGDGTEKELETEQRPARDNEDPNYTDYTFPITDVSETNGTCGLRLLVYEVGGKSYGFCNIVIKGTVDGTAEEETLYTVTTGVNIDGAGSVTKSAPGKMFTPGKSITFSAVANSGYKFIEKWTVNDTEATGEKYTIENLSANTTVTAQFEKLPVLTFAKPDDVTCVKSAFPANINTIDKGEKYTLPNNYMYYKEGYTMTGWSDGTNEYACGAEYTVDGDATLSPVFTQNTTSLAAHKEALELTFDFDQDTNGKRVVNIEGNEDIFITRANIDGKEDIDVTLAINCTKNAGVSGKTGKVNNTSGSRAQVNVGSIFTIPAEAGSVITLYNDNKNAQFTATTFNGEKGTYDNTALTATYTATKAGDVTVIVMESDMYFKKITVTYPAVKSYALTTEDTDLYSLYLDYDATIPEGITAYTGTLDEANSVLNLTEIEGTVIPANTGVLVKSAEAKEYTFAVADDAAAEITSDLKGVTTATEATALATDGKTVLTLGLLDGELGFRKPAESKIEANKVYLLVNEASAAKGVSISFGGDATGIIEVNAAANAADAPAFNLAGQRVANGTKGLLIKNGKKFVNK